MPSPYDILGTVLGILGILGVGQLVYCLLYGHLPSQRLKELDETLTNTIHFLYIVVEDGFLPDTVFVESTQRRLSVYRVNTETFRSQVHRATSFSKQCYAMARGLSHEINTLCSKVKAARADISSASDKARQMLEEAARHEAAIAQHTTQSLATACSSSSLLEVYPESSYIAAKPPVMGNPPCLPALLRPPLPVYSQIPNQHLLPAYTLHRASNGSTCFQCFQLNTSPWCSRYCVGNYLGGPPFAEPHVRCGRHVSDLSS